MEEAEFIGSVIAWFLLCATIGILEVKLVTTYEKREVEILKILFEKINFITKANKKIEFKISLPKIGLEVTKIKRVNESTIQIIAPFCENVTVSFDENVSVFLNEQGIVLTRKN
ncbi:MAG: hypothetical protein QXS21_00970 [Thermoproteota archaeon]|nr:hypothetical protein [Candidatus Brockarchaeota archaeon]MBO3768330.1 hypothetical protein [Candidatus Brockarchaeota archaeon]MBO3800984.1 hypothetical protein [Candidatus Brockarchaeota archaeon]